MLNSNQITSTSDGPSAKPASRVPDSSASALLGNVWSYILIARPDHWFKNVFMVIGIVVAYFYRADLLANVAPLTILWAFVATCLVASSNYVINEVLDAPSDRRHPVKKHRPVPAGKVSPRLAYLEWLALGVVGLVLAHAVNTAFFVAAASFWIMGLIYNVRPIRSKEIPYVDVLSESINNPLRLLLGWFTVGAIAIPPTSLLISFWMVGAFFMATKRFAEYRSLGDAKRAAEYRTSFRYYDENSLLTSMFFYATAAALFLGVFIIRYHLELIVGVPLIAGFFSYYFRLALKTDSPVQAPEKLYREWRLVAYLIVCVATFVGLMLIRISVLYDWFNVRPADFPQLWEF